MLVLNNTCYPVVISAFGVFGYRLISKLAVVPNVQYFNTNLTPMTPDGQYVCVKRMTDTYFVSLPLSDGATTDDLYIKTAAIMNVSRHDLRLCRMDQKGHVIFLTESDSTQKSRNEVLVHPPHMLSVTGKDVIYAILRTSTGWEQPCVVDYPIEDDQTEIGKTSNT